MKKKRNCSEGKSSARGQLLMILLMFGFCSAAEYVEFLFIRTDRTILADNIGTKIVCILAVVMILKYADYNFREIGFRGKGMLKGVLSGLALGTITFGISYFAEILILQAQGHTVTLRFFITNFALTGASTQLTASFAAVLICIAVNLINVFAEEGLFRGLFLKLGTERFGFAAANWIQAALFGVWHMVMVAVGLYDGLMNVPEAIVMAVGYLLLAGILGLEWGVCVSLSGTLWIGLSEHFFNNFIGNTLHVVTESGTDELQIARIVLSNLLSLTIVLLIRRRSGRRPAAAEKR